MQQIEQYGNLECEMDMFGMKNWWKTALGVLLFCLMAPAFAVMQTLDDQSLSQETGQAAFYTSYTAPTGDGSGATATGTNAANYGFFTLGLNGEIDINANIQHLQLGCGGVNGPGCDIDINNLSLSGNPGVGTCPVGASPASCDAVLNNPFIRLAIRNPTTLATRSLAGFQLGAQSVVGLLQAGTNSNTPNGINALSGYMPVQSTAGSPTLTGTINTSAQYFNIYNPAPGTPASPGIAATPGTCSSSTAGYCTNNDPASPYYTVSGTLQGQLFGLNAAVAKFTLTGGGFYIPGFNNINFSVPAPVLNGSRLPGIAVYPFVSLPNVIVGYTPDDADCGGGGSNCNGTAPTYNNTYSLAGSSASYTVGTGQTVGTQGGPVTATSTACSGIGCFLLSGSGVGDVYTVHMYGQVSNIGANVTFNQPLGYVHSIPLNSPLSLSLQSSPINWPGTPTADVAQPGWWMSVTDPVILGNLTPTSAVSLCPVASNPAMCVFPQFAKQFNTFLQTPLSSSDLFALLSGGTIGAQFGNLSLTPISLSLNGIQLSTQGTKANCYGSLKFC